VHWLEEEGASWGVWSTVQSEVRASMAAIRAAVRRAGLQRLVITGHSLGGGYAKEAARQLARRRRALGNPRIEVVTFGAPAVFARRDGCGCRRGLWRQRAGWFEATIGVVSTAVGRGRGCRLPDDQYMRTLHAQVAAHAPVK
jgi:hypothetical protein